MVRRELIFFGVLFGMMLNLLLGTFLYPEFLILQGYWSNIIPIVILIGFIIPRYFSKKYNNWLETDPILN
jgi:hypothetical protein